MNKGTFIIALACSSSSIAFAQNIKTITITDGADVKTLLGSDKDGVDSLVINGHIKQADISIIKNFCQDRKREIGLNLSGSTVEGDSLATDAFQGADVSYFEFPKQLNKLGSFCFKYSKLRKISLPLTLKEVSPEAFSLCFNLKEAHIPEGVELIDSCAFMGCTALEKLYLPSTLRRIGLGAFYSLESLKELVVPEGVETIGWRACEDMKKLERVQLPNSLKNMADVVFNGCSNLTEVVLPKNLKTIPYMTFNGCRELNNVKWSGDLEKIGDYAFDFNDFTDLVLPSTVQEIGDRAFANTGRVSFNDIETKVLLPDGLRKIGNLAFSYSPKLKEIEIPSTVNTIGYGAFLACTSIVKAVLPATITAIPDKMFASTSLETINWPDNLTTIGEEAFTNAKLESIVFPDNLKEIRDMAFQNNDNLIYVMLSKDFETLGLGAFEGCSRLKIVCAQNPVPPTITNGDQINQMQVPFAGISPDAVLYVPVGAKEAYKNSWLISQSFKDIVETDNFPTGILSVPAVSNNIVGGKGNITIYANSDELLYSIFSLSGSLYKKGVVKGNTSVIVPAGTYIVKTTYGKVKVVVK